MNADLEALTDEADPVQTALSAIASCLRLGGDVTVTVRKTRLPDGRYRVTIEVTDTPAE